MAKFDLSFTILDLEGKPLKGRGGEHGLTAGEVLLMALQYEEPQGPVSLENRTKRFMLAARIATAKSQSVEFSNEEAVFLKQLVGATRWMPTANAVVITGRINDWLEGKDGTIH